ncbi:MAG TPA: hypothetical protein VNZ22_05425, partial [Bacillota bacterium]|nr:hypothetical protein [Bacillota bacterium]
MDQINMSIAWQWGISTRRRKSKGVMKIVPKLIAACATATLVGASALAQQDQQSQPSGQQSGQQTSTSSSQPQQQPSGGQQNEALQKANAQEFFRSSKIVGKSAQDQK